MTRRFDAAYYEDLQGRVRGVLIEVSDALPANKLGLVDEMIDAGEPGVALEVLIEMLVEADVPISATVGDQIQRLIRDMELPPRSAQRAKGLEAP